MATSDGGRVILYDFFASNCAWRVRTVLHWKQVSYETRSVNLLASEQHKPAFLKINPYGAVPVLSIDGHYLTQSAAICEYLDANYPEKVIFPKDPYEKAQMRTIVEVINSHLVPLPKPSGIGKKSADHADEQRAWSMEFFTKGFVALEKLLKETSGQYCVGDTVTFADMTLYPQVWRAKRLKMDFAKFPTIARIDGELNRLEAFRAAHALNHKDCPIELRSGFS